MPIFEVRWTERRSRIMAARSSLEAVCDMAQHYRPADGFEVECLELREVPADAGRQAEVGVVEWFELGFDGQLARRGEAQSWVPLWVRGLCRVPAVLIQELRAGLEGLAREAPERRRHAA